MTEPRHTPGPWHYKMFSRSAPHFNIGPIDDDGKFDFTQEVAITVSGYDPEAVEIAMANARLIAAAPDLLEACQSALAQLDYLQDLWSKEGITSTIAERLRAAVARAVPPIAAKPEELSQ